MFPISLEVMVFHKWCEFQVCVYEECGIYILVMKTTIGIVFVIEPSYLQFPSQY